jgi:cysteine-rich repeat protein
MARAQTLWSEQFYTRSYAVNTHRSDQAIGSPRIYTLPEYREAAEAAGLSQSNTADAPSSHTHGMAGMATVWADARARAQPTLFESLGSGLDGRSIDSMPINGRNTRNDTDLSSSSFESTATSPRLGSAGRLNGTTPWVPKFHNPYEFVQLSYPTATLVSHISTAGGGAYHDGWVTTFKLSHSFDGISWQWYTEPGSPVPHVFSANTDRATVVRHRLHGGFHLTSMYATGENGNGRAKQGTSAPLLTRFLRVYPVTWYGTKIALRFDILRRLECGDGFWDEMHEKCDDGNVVSGDGCSGTSGEWQGTAGPCEKETFTTRTKYNSKYPQRYKDGRDVGSGLAHQTRWCHRGSDCSDCQSLRVNPTPKQFFDAATQQYFDDPLHMQECAGRRSHLVGADGVTHHDRPSYPDNGFRYRTQDPRALGTRHRPSSTLP